jgi:SAM-dependent methyltransferase
MPPFDGRPVRVDVGCGERKIPGAIGIDTARISGVDLLGDLERGLPLRDGSVDVLHAYHVLEHVRDFIGSMEEIWRVLRDGGVAHIKAPHAASPYTTWKDPTHRRGLSIATFAYFDDTYFDGQVFAYYSKARFRIEHARLCFSGKGAPVPLPDELLARTDLPPPEPHLVRVLRRGLNPMFHALANRSRGWQYACERFWGPLTGIEEVYVVLRALKA